MQTTDAGAADLMVVAEALAGIALVKAAVDGIKSTIGTAKDISTIASDIDALFQGSDEVQKKASKKSGVRLGDQFGVDTVAKEIIDQRLAAEALREVAAMCDLRFGHGTWASILAERQKRIQKQREAQAKARKEAQIKHDEMIEGLKAALIISGTIAVAVGLFVFFMVSVAGAIGIA